MPVTTEESHENITCKAIQILSEYIRSHLNKTKKQLILTRFSTLMQLLIDIITLQKSLY